MVLAKPGITDYPTASLRLGGKKGWKPFGVGATEGGEGTVSTSVKEPERC